MVDVTCSYRQITVFFFPTREFPWNNQHFLGWKVTVDVVIIWEVFFPWLGPWYEEKTGSGGAGSWKNPLEIIPISTSGKWVVWDSNRGSQSQRETLGTFGRVPDRSCSQNMGPPYCPIQPLYNLYIGGICWYISRVLAQLFPLPIPIHSGKLTFWSQKSWRWMEDDYPFQRGDF